MQELDRRRYRINRRSDVQIAAVSLQRQDYYPDLSAIDRAALGTIIAELGSNILKYGLEGTIQISRVVAGTQQGILIEAQDQGPGIADVERSLQDHFSTGNTLGLGLPAVKRMSDELSIDSGADRGTHVRALRWVRSETAPHGERPAASTSFHGQPSTSNSPDKAIRVQPATTGCQLNLESRIRPCYPERLSGDQILALRQGDLWLQAIVDGYGHGPEAHAAACGIITALQRRFLQLTDDHLQPAVLPAEQWLTALLRTSHQQASGGRGGAIGLSLIDGRQWRLWFSGVGNTRILQYKAKGWTGVSRDGQIGDRFPTPFVQSFPLEPNDTVVQFSDGLRESAVRSLRHSMGATPSPAALADELMRHGSRSDDVSVLVMQCQP